MGFGRAGIFGAGVLVAAAARSRLLDKEPVKAARITDSGQGRGGWQLESVELREFRSVQVSHASIRACCKPGPSFRH